MVEIVGLSGEVLDNIAGNSGSYVFIGPTATVTTTAGQRITGVVEAPLGKVDGAPHTFRYDLCYRLAELQGVSPTNFAGQNYSESQATVERHEWTAAGTKVMAGGTWEVGMCVQNIGPDLLDNNDWLNGWLMVTN